MRTHTTQAVTLRALRRNRLILMAGILLLLPIIGWAAGLFSNGLQPGMLLLAIDELQVDRSAVAGPATVPVTHANDHAPIPFIAPVDDQIASIEELSDDSDGAIEVADDHDADIRWFNGRPVRPVRTMAMMTTAYSPDERSCGQFADGITASGYSVWTNGMALAAADTNVLPLGTMISVPGYDDDRVIPVLDRGGAIKGNRLDLLYPTHEEALEWGVQQLQVTVWEYADGLPGDFEPRFNRAASVKN